LAPDNGWITPIFTAAGCAKPARITNGAAIKAAPAPIIARRRGNPLVICVTLPLDMSFLRSGFFIAICGFSSPLHSITVSALTSNVYGIARPNVFAVFWLITNSNLVGACTGKSAGLVPFRIRSTYVAARSKRFSMSTP